MIGPGGSLIHTHIATMIDTGRSMMRSSDDTMISATLLAIRHHAVIDTDASSIIGIPPIQFSRAELSGVYLDILGYMRGIPYILASVNIFPSSL